MDSERAANFSFLDFVGGIQLLQEQEARTAVPVVLVGICVSGAVGNLLVLLVFMRDFRNGRGSEAKALLASLVSTDLLILLLCAPVRAVTYSKQTWTLGAFVCRTADWFQHSCVAARALTLAVTTRAKHTAMPGPAAGAPRSPTWIHGALALVWTVAVTFPVPQMLFASLVPHGGGYVCVSAVPACASDFMGLFYKIYPAVTFVAPVVVAVASHTKALHRAVNYAPGPQQQSRVSLVLLCLSGELGLLLLPEWGAFTWTRLGFARPPAGLLIFAQVLLYACSAASPLILIAMYDDVRRGLAAGWLAATCREAKRAPRDKCVKAGGSGAETGANANANANDVANAVAQEDDEKTFPDVEHFWTGRRNTQVEEAQDPVPWEREEKML